MEAYFEALAERMGSRDMVAAPLLLKSADFVRSILERKRSRLAIHEVLTAIASRWILQTIP